MEIDDDAMIMMKRRSKQTRAAALVYISIFLFNNSSHIL
jgi:hypothetical protein